MLEPLKQFICDTCSQVIENFEDGWVEWEGYFKDNKRIEKNFRICHHNQRCQKLAWHPHCSDLPLYYVAGDHAIPFLFSNLDIGPYHEPEYGGPSIVDLREYTEFMRRLTLPYYEEARQWWAEAMSDGYFSDANEIYIYLPESLKRMIDYYSNK